MPLSVLGIVSSENWKGNAVMKTQRTFGPRFSLDGTRDTAQKTEVARFQGIHYVAEREDDELVIYALHDEHGMPAQEVRTTDRPPRTLSDLNRFNANHYSTRKSA
jgi:hypothetical protein